MYKFVKFCSLFLFFVMISTLSMICEAEKQKVAIIPFEKPVKNIIKHANITDPTEILIEEMSASFSNSYEVINQEKVSMALKEKGLEANTPIDTDKAVEIGKLVGANYVLTGEIPEFVSVSMMKIYKSTIMFIYKFIDVQTGEIKYKNNNVILGRGSANFGSRETEEDIVHKACKDATLKVMNDLVFFVKASVTKVSGNMIYVDFGINGGFKKDEILNIVRETESIEADGKIIGMKEIDVGTAKVVYIYNNYSVCKITKGNGAIQKGDIVKKIKKG